MKINNLLALVIPFYKVKFLETTLESISNQTCKKFTLYIGDDCSPDNIQPLLEKYKGLINIVYKRFDKNIGKFDLVAHWNRCLEMIGDEEWFGLFSDDDIMPIDFVELFYSNVNVVDTDVFHYDIKIINENNEIIDKINKYREFDITLSSEKFFNLLWSRKIYSVMPEYIFNKKFFIFNGGFVNFPHAMGSDTATVMKIASQKGIFTIRQSKVLWRRSSISVSSSQSDPTLQLERELALIMFLNWTKSFFEMQGKSLPLSFYYKNKLIFGTVKRMSPHLSFQSIIGNINKIDMSRQSPIKYIFYPLYFVIWIIKHRH